MSALTNLGESARSTLAAGSLASICGGCRGRWFLA